jgi:hypothetical protein
MKKALKKLRARDKARGEASASKLVEAAPPPELAPKVAEAAPTPELLEALSSPVRSAGFTFPELVSLPEAGAGALSEEERAVLLAAEEMSAEEKRAIMARYNAAEWSEWREKEAMPMEPPRQVRVVEEHPLWMLRFGERATCNRLASEEEAEVRFEKPVDLHDVTVPLSILALEPLLKWKPLAKLKTDKMSQTHRRLLLSAVGVEHCFHPGPEEVREKQLSPEHIDLWVEHSEMSKPEAARVRGIPVILSALVVAGERHEGWAHWGAGQVRERHGARVRYLRSCMDTNEMLVFPIYESSHFCVLSLRKSGAGVEARYYESLPRLLEGPLSSARTLMTVLGVPGEVPILRANVSRQGPDECGWFALHYFEQEWRVGLGEPRGHLGAPTLEERRAMRKTLSSLRQASLTGLTKWRQDEEQQAEKSHLILERARRNFAAILRRRNVWHEVLRELKAAAALSREAGENALSEPPPLRIHPPSAYETPKKRKQPSEPTSAGVLWLEGDEPPTRSPQRPEEISEEETERPEGVPAEAERKLGAGAEAAAVAADPRGEEGRRGETEGGAVVEGAAVAAAAVEEELPAWVARHLEGEPPASMEPCDVSLRTDEILGAYAERALIAGAGFELLRPEYQEQVLKVMRYGHGVCSRCRFTTGCLSCDPDKALRYWMKKELSAEPPRGPGRPKKKART